MAADFENMGYGAVPKTIPRIKMAAKLNLRVAKALRPSSVLKIAADFENMSYEAVPKTFCRIKMGAELD